jgi:uncharacterized membrane protein
MIQKTFLLMEHLKMTNFFPAFFCVFCLMSIGVIGLGIGLGFVNAILGLLAIVSCVVAMYSVAGSIED